MKLRELFKSKNTKEVEKIIRKGVFLLNNKPYGFLSLNNNSASYIDALINFEVNTFKDGLKIDSVVINACFTIRCHYALNILDIKKSEQIIEVEITKFDRLLLRKSDGPELTLKVKKSIKKAIENKIKSLVVVK